MKKGQVADKDIKNILKFLKINENTISTIMGVVVIFVLASLIFNYFKSANLKIWQGTLLDQQEAKTTDKINEILGKDGNDTYIVKKGDDLWHISEKYYKSGYNYVDLIRENKLKSSGVIEAGQELKIPKVEPKKITVHEIDSKKEIVITDEKVEQKTTQIKNTSQESIATGEYVTQKGDSYWNIAVRAYGDGFKWTKIFWANRKIFGNPDVIHAQVKITIPELKD